MEEQPTKLKTPKWLKHLQENSWEAEILISGGAIFSLFQLVELVIEFREYLKEVAPFDGLAEVTVVLILLVRGISIGFAIHLVLRGFWIGLVCLRSVFPNGINFQRLRLSGAYLSQAKKLNLTDNIIQLDQFIGLVFFGSFLFMIAIVGFMVICTFFINLLIAFNFNPWILLIVIVIYLIDLLSAGLLRRNKLVGKIYLPIYWFFNALSLGFIYRPYLQVIASNIRLWKIGLFFFTILFSSIILVRLSLSDAFHWGFPFDQRTHFLTESTKVTTDQLYLDRIPNDSRIRWACIQSDIIEESYVRVFVPYKAVYNENILKDQPFSEIVTLTLNDSLINKPDWIDYTRNNSHQYGIVTYLAIDQLPKGKNEITISIKGEKFYHEEDKLTIPFWK